MSSPSSSRKRKKCQEEKESSPIRKGKRVTSKRKDVVVKEKRADRYRSNPTADIKQRICRAVSQRLYLISQEDKSSSDSASRHFAVLGSTGNVYNVTIERKPGCTCPGELMSSLFLMNR